jgi:hypothetical protein
MLAACDRSSGAAPSEAKLPSREGASKTAIQRTFATPEMP